MKSRLLVTIALLFGMWLMWLALGPDRREAAKSRQRREERKDRFEQENAAYQDRKAQRNLDKAMDDALRGSAPYGRIPRKRWD